MPERKRTKVAKEPSTILRLYLRNVAAFVVEEKLDESDPDEGLMMLLETAFEVPEELSEIHRKSLICQLGAVGILELEADLSELLEAIQILVDDGKLDEYFKI